MIGILILVLKLLYYIIILVVGFKVSRTDHSEADNTIDHNTNTFIVYVGVFLVLMSALHILELILKWNTYLN